MNHNQLLSLRVNNKLLRENTNVAPLIPVLLSDKVIREEHVGIIERGSTRQEKSKLFFEDVLIKKGFGGYWSVIRGLRQSMQGDIADILENTICDSAGGLPRDRLKKRRRIIIRAVRKPDSDEATSATEERIISFLLTQCQSVAPSTLRENILNKYSFYVEQIEPVPVCIVILPRRLDRLAQFDRDVASGYFKVFVIDCLGKLGEFGQFQRAWDIEVSVEREELPDGAVEEEEETDEEFEDASSGTLQTDSAPSSSYREALDSGIGSHVSVEGPRSTSQHELGIPASINEDSIQRDRIAHSVLQLYVNSPEYTGKDLLQQLVSTMKKGVNVMNLRDSEGFSLLHQAMAKDRGDLVIVFYDLGLLGEMQRLRVTDRRSPNFDMTPLALAESERKRGREQLESFIQKDKKLTKLCKIARKGDLERLRTHVEKKPEDVHYRSDGDGSFPVYWACVANSRPCLDYLIENGGDINATTKDGENILTKVASIGHGEMVQYLLKKYRMDPNVKGLKKKTAAERAAETGDYHLLKLLLKHRASLENTILHAAARGGQVDFIQKVMESYSSQLNVNGRDSSHRTPLHHAADHAHVTTIQTLMSYGADITMLDKRRRNVLHYLADSFCTEGADAVLEQARRRSVIAIIVNQTELYLGAEQCFLVRGRDKGQYAWHYVVVDRGLLSIFKKVINRGQVDVGRYGRIIVSGWGLAPAQETVEQIAKRYDPTIVREGAKPDMSPLHYSIVRENDALTIKLIQNGANVNQKDCFGLTPLHLAAMRGQLIIVKQLEARGADLDALDHKQRRPLDVAEANRQVQVANYLKSARDISKCRNFVENQLPNIQNGLQFDSLETMRNSGQDVRIHVIQQLREMEAKIHDLLYEVGTTPVMQATTAPDENTRNMMQATGEAEQLPTTPRNAGPYPQETVTLGEEEPEELGQAAHGGTREAVAALGGRVGEEWPRPSESGPRSYGGSVGAC